MKKLLCVLSLVLVLSSAAFASDLVIDVKRTNVGIAGAKSADLIFEILNKNFQENVEGLLYCKSPDDVLISSTEGAAAGKAIYSSNKFEIGPASHKSITLTLGSDTPGDKRGGCTVKYIVFKEATGTSTTTSDAFTYTGAIGTSQHVLENDKKIMIAGFEAAVEAANDTEAVPAKVTFDVDGVEGEVEVGGTATISTLEITVSAATADSADVEIAGTKTVTTPGTIVRQYKTPVGDYITEDQLTDSHYQEIRLDQSFPFVAAGATSAECPAGQANCKVSDAIVEGGTLDIGGYKIPVIIAVVVLLILAVIYLFGKTSGLARS